MLGCELAQSGANVPQLRGGQGRGSRSNGVMLAVSLPNSFRWRVPFQLVQGPPNTMQGCKQNQLVRRGKGGTTPPPGGHIQQ